MDFNRFCDFNLSAADGMEIAHHDSSQDSSRRPFSDRSTVRAFFGDSEASFVNTCPGPALSAVSDTHTRSFHLRILHVKSPHAISHQLR